MRIGILTSIHTNVLKYCCADLAWGFREIGHEVEVLDENSPWCDANGQDITPDEMGNFIYDFKPDVLIQFDGVRANHGLVVPPEIPFISWMMDRLHWICNSEVSKLIRENDRIFFMFDELRWEFIDKYEYPAKLCHTLHMGVNTETYDLVPKRKNNKFDVEIAFVTRLKSEMPETRLHSRMGAARVMIETGRSVGLYGEGWDEYAEFKPYYRGRVEPGRELAACYQLADLHVHANEDTNWHMRPLEVIACGGRIAHYVPARTGGISKSFPYPWSHAFSNAGELDRIRQLIQDSRQDGTHKIVSEAQHQWVRAAHGYDTRATQILAIANLPGIALPF